MSQDLNLVAERQSKRYQLLRLIYNLSGGSTSKRVSVIELRDESGFPINEVEEALDYLQEEYLIKEGSNERFDVFIKHAGVIEVEQSISNPAKPTEHFTTQVIQHFHGTVGAIQNAPHSTANIQQNIGADSSDVLRLIQELRQSFQSLPPEQRDDALQLVDSLQEEAQSPSPRKERMKAFLRGLGTFTIDTASNVLAAAIAKSLGLPS